MGAAPAVAPCTLNAVVAEIDPQATIHVGAQPYVYRDDLDSLRQAHRETHYFKRDRDSIISVAVVNGYEPIGEARVRRVREVGSLMPPLVLDALLRYYVAQGRRVLRHRPLTVVTARRDDRLLTHALPEGARLPTWLEQRISYVFEARPVYPEGQPPTVLVACDARTCITIDARGDTLLSAGVPLEGLYVAGLTGTEGIGDPRLSPKARIVGRVVQVDGNQLVLDDYGSGPEVRAAADVWLEPRRENLAHCLRHLMPEQAEAALERLEALVAEVAGGPERLRRISSMFDHLRRVPLEVVPGIPIRLSGLVKHGRKAAWSPPQGALKRPALIFDPAGRRTDEWNERGLNKFGPYDRGSFAITQPRIAVVCQRKARPQVEQFVTRLLNGMPEVEFGGRRPYGNGLTGRFGLQTPTVEYFETADATAEAYQTACRSALQRAADQSDEWHLALVQIDDAFHLLSGGEDPYLVSKSAFMKHQVPVQEVTLEKMLSAPRDLVYILSDISLAVYAKLGGVPWVLPVEGAVAHEVILGLGSYHTSESRLGAKERVVGVTTAFTSDGRYLLESRTTAVPYEGYAVAMLASLRQAVETIRRDQNWQPGDSVRLIVHAFKPVKDAEVDAVEKLMAELGLANGQFAFLHVAEDHPFLLVDEAQPGVPFKGANKGAFAPPRGTIVPLGRDEWLVALTGPKELKQASGGLPRPVFIKLHRKSTFRNMRYLVRQAYSFSCHSWRGFGLSSQPITIQYSDQIARVLRRLDRVPDWDSDAMAGRIGRTRWFL